MGSDLGIMVVCAALLSRGGVVFSLPHPPSLDPHAFLCPIIPSNALAALGYCIWSALSSCMPSISASLRPCCLSSCRNLLFSSSTLRAADCISALASTPTCSQVRYFVSNSWRYSLRRARERRWLSRMRARLAVRWADVCSSSVIATQGWGTLLSSIYSLVAYALFPSLLLRVVSFGRIVS